MFKLTQKRFNKNLSPALKSGVRRLNKKSQWKLVIKESKPYWYNFKTKKMIWVEPDIWEKRPKNIMKGLSDYPQWEVYWDSERREWFWYNDKKNEFRYRNPYKRKRSRKITRSESRSIAHKKKRKAYFNNERKLRNAERNPVELMDKIRERSSQEKSSTSKSSEKNIFLKTIDDLLSNQELWMEKSPKKEKKKEKKKRKKRRKKKEKKSKSTFDIWED